jgi:hypothetical protein
MKNFCILFFLVLNSVFSFQSNAQTANAEILKCKVTIDGIDPDTISKLQFQNATKLHVDSIGLKITSFEFSVYRKNKKPLVLRNRENALFTKEMKDVISDCETGSKIFIEYITCVDIKNISHTLSPFSIKIK